ncbi:MAG: hypothetical protein HYT49_03815 [Candidatus Wildermuthbacteria bacterium]|nr:hypothetical protein [Candidatus Wildermuthbacteria bacterium]
MRAEESDCAITFLRNKGENLENWRIVGHPEDSIIDVELKELSQNYSIHAQVRVLNDEFHANEGRFGSSAGGGTPETLAELIFNATEEKSKQYGVNSTKDIVLLLYSPLDVLDIFIDKIKKNLEMKNLDAFQQIWVVCPAYCKNVQIK